MIRTVAGDIAEDRAMRRIAWACRVVAWGPLVLAVGGLVALLRLVR